MIRFAHDGYLYLLLLLPALVLFYWTVVKLRKKAIARFADPSNFGRLAESVSRAKPVLKFAILLGAIATLVLGLANPQIGTRTEEVKEEGVDLFIVLDVSLSMRAEDIKPNRMEKAKLEIRNLIDRLKGDRIGLIVFAGDAYTQFPLTTDYGAAYLFLDVVDTDVAPVPGSSIASAIKRAMESFNFDEPTTKVVVIITDGEITDGDAFGAAEDAHKKGVLLYTIGMGSPAGAPIPIYDASGRQVDFKRDREGNVVVTRLDEVSLQKIADIGSGSYYRASNAQDELDEIYKKINTLQKREFGTKQIVDYEDRFQYLLGPAILLLLLEVLISEKKVPWLPEWSVLRKEEEISA